MFGYLFCVHCLENERGYTPEFDRFMADHKCAINYSGSEGTMEANGVVQIFKESKHVHKVRITNFIGDGNSKSHASVVNAGGPVFWNNY